MGEWRTLLAEEHMTRATGKRGALVFTAMTNNCWNNELKDVNRSLNPVLKTESFYPEEILWSDEL